MTKVQERDFERAQAFFAGDDALELLEKYEPEMDSELRGDSIKAANYVLYREMGLSSFFANINACRRAPGASNIDRHFSEKARHRMNTMSQANLNKIVTMAQNAGVSTQGKFYVGGLGRYTDKHAWVSSAEDLVSVAKQRRLNVDGAIKYEGARSDMGPVPSVPLASDIVQRKVGEILQREPATAEKVRKNPKKINELKERVIAKHGKPKR